MRDHYATLEVEPGIDGASLRRAYHSLMQRYHPDLNSCAEAEAKCRAINEAYACLRDPEARATYDARMRAYQRSRRAAFSLSTRAYQPTSHDRQFEWLNEEAASQTRASKAIIISVALLMTILTFAATSAVDNGGAPQETMVTIVKMAPDPGAQGTGTSQQAR